MYPCVLTFMGNSDYSAPTRQGLGEEKIIISQKGYYFPFGQLVPTSMLCSSKWSHRNTNHTQAPSNEIYFNEKSIQTPNLIKTIPLLPMLVTSTLVRYTDRCKEKGDDFNQTVKPFPFSLHSSGTQTSVRRRWVTLTRLLETEHV